MLLRVVYLDDEPDLCEIFSDLFSSDNVQITTYSDPKIAIEEVNKNPPDIVFLDYRLPGTNGEKVAMEMKGSMRKFLVTGEINPQLTFNFEKILKKPIEISVISKILEE